MKKILLGLVGTVMTLTAITSCKKLDLAPYNAVSTETGFSSWLDARYWDNGLYAQLRGRLYGSYNVLQETAADQVNASLDFGNRGGATHRWGNFLQANDVAGPYQGYYSAIANANMVIAGLDRIPIPPSTAQQDTLTNAKADARAVRAFYYHELMTRYAKPYNPATAATDLGVPLLTVYDVTALPSRANSRAVYDQILADITYAKANNKRANRAASATAVTVKFTPDALLALEARVRLAMQDWTGAYAAASALISSGRYPLYTTEAALRNYWHTETARQEDIFRINATTAEAVNVNAIYLGYSGQNQWYVPDFIPTQTVVDSYEATDFRRGIYFAQFPIFIQGIRYNNIWLVNKFPGVPSLFTGTFTNYMHSPKVFRIGEIYTIAAEAAERGGSTPVNALIALNALRVARGVSAIAPVGAALTQAVRDERTREMNFDGFRLWDLKRWGLGFTRGTPQNTVFVNTGAGFTGLVVTAGDNKFTWGIPTNDLQLNANLIPNPGW